MTVVRQMTEEKRARIAELWNKGMSSSQIANDIGLSRNSVIGAVHRLRAKGMIMASRFEKRKYPSQARTAMPIRKNLKKKVELGTPVDILKLTFQSCRYIVEEGNVLETKYCNNKIDRASYCAEHYKICYTPTRR